MSCYFTCLFEFLNKNLVEMSLGCRYFSDRRYAGIVEFTAELQPLHRHEHTPHTTLVEGYISIAVGVIPLFPCGAGIVCTEARSETTAERVHGS